MGRSHLFRKWTDMDNTAEELRSVSTDSTEKDRCTAASNDSIADGSSSVFSRKPLEKRMSELSVPFPNNEGLFQRRSSIRQILNAVLPPEKEQKKDDSIFLLFERDCNNMRLTSFTPLSRYDYEHSLEVEEIFCLDTIVEDAQDLVQEMEGKMKHVADYVSPFRNILDLIPAFDELHCNLKCQYRRIIAKVELKQDEDIINLTEESNISLVRSLTERSDFLSNMSQDIAYIPNFMYTVKWSAVPLICMKHFSLYPTSLCLLQSHYIGTILSSSITEECNSFTTDSIFSELSEINKEEDDLRSALSSTSHEQKVAHQAFDNPNLWQRLFQRKA